MKINQLLKDLPAGSVATQVWLNRRGIYPQLSRRYVSSGWLDRAGRGAFVRSGDRVDWMGGVFALQSQLGMRVHVGGVTALHLKGFGQYIPLGGSELVYLFSDAQEKLPSWFRQRPWKNPVAYHCVRLFDNSQDVGFFDADRGSFAVRASSPERAILEVMHLATTNDAFDYALELFEGLTTLRPTVLQKLLEECRSVKVKRLFLWAGEQANYGWFERLDASRVDLGKGKRTIYSGGKLDKKYQITVPIREGLPDV